MKKILFILLALICVNVYGEDHRDFTPGSKRVQVEQHIHMRDSYLLDMKFNPQNSDIDYVLARIEQSKINRIISDLKDKIEYHKKAIPTCNKRLATIKGYAKKGNKYYDPVIEEEIKHLERTIRSHKEQIEKSEIELNNINQLNINFPNL